MVKRHKFTNPIGTNWDLTITETITETITLTADSSLSSHRLMITGDESGAG